MKHVLRRPIPRRRKAAPVTPQNPFRSAMSSPSSADQPSPATDPVPATGIRVNDLLYLDEQPVCDWEQMKHSYRCRYDAHGFTSATLFYSRDQLHRDRLSQVSTILLRHVHPEDTLLDVGCGYGDVIPYLPPCQYQGIDLIDFFVCEARVRHPAFSFGVANILDVETPFDWVAMIGIMGTLPRPEEVLIRASELAGKGLIVDFIDACNYNGPLNRYDLGRCVNLLRSLGLRQVSVLGTPHHPWTFIVASKDGYFENSP